MAGFVIGFLCGASSIIAAVMALYILVPRPIGWEDWG
jgi:hypothetical protein